MSDPFFNSNLIGFIALGVLPGIAWMVLVFATIFK